MLEINEENLKNDFKQNACDAEKSTDSNFGPNGSQVENGLRSRELVAQTNKTSAMQISRYLRLNYLVTPLLDLVDDNVIAVRAAVELSYLQPSEQKDLTE